MSDPAQPVPEASPSCRTCGKQRPDVDPWLGICLRCLAQASQVMMADAGPTFPSLPGYLIKRHIGHGSMGVVYEATREADGTRVAIKCIHPEMAGEPRFHEQFKREAEALHRLSYPGIVEVLETCVIEGRDAIVLEFVDGPDLRQVLKRGPVSVQRAVQIAAEVAEAMAVAHAVGLIHRDLKPANILIAADGKVKVADFGMARPPREVPQDARLADTLVAAPGHYNAPELERHGIADARADIYSLGALLYHLLVGEPPRAHYLPASKARSGSLITHSLDSIITRALQPDPQKRFTSMTELAAQLRREEARILEFIADPSARRRRRWRMIGIAAALLLAGWLATSGYRAHREATARQALLARLAPLPKDWKPVRRTNSLGMEFVSIPDCEVMFCVWETRVQDYQDYVTRSAKEDKAWSVDTGFAFPRKEPCFALIKGEFKAGIYSWSDPGFESGPKHPVSGVSLFDAEAFCMWLTWKERRSGVISADQTYRLPTDDEWSSAAGLRKEPGTTPDERLGSWSNGKLLFEWGESFDPVPAIVNVAGQEVRSWEHWPWPWVRVKRADPWLGTAPVDSAPPSRLGLHHLTGNLWEWTETPINLDNQSRIITLRGGSWMNALPEALSLMSRDSDRGDVRMTKRGFRVVFQPKEASGWRYGGKR